MEREQQSLHEDISVQFDTDISVGSSSVKTEKSKESKEILSFESSEQQIMEAIKSIEEAVSLENSSVSEEVSPTISRQSTLGEVSSDFSGIKPGSDTNDVMSDLDKTDSECKDNNLTASSSDDVITQLWVHRNPHEEQSDGSQLLKDASDAISSTLFENSSSTDCATDNDVSESSNIVTSTLEAEENGKNSPKAFAKEEGSDGNLENGIEEYLIRPHAPTVVSIPESNGVISDTASDLVPPSQQIDLVWDTDIPSETEVKRVPVTSYIKQSSQHSLDRPNSDPEKVKPTTLPSAPGACTPEIENITVFNETELQPRHRRPVSDFTGTFNDHSGEDSLVETTWDSESVTSQKELPTDEPDFDQNNHQETPVNETKSDHTFTSQPTLESKLQISISTNVMDCTIKADNLPIKKAKATTVESKPVGKTEPQNLETNAGKEPERQDQPQYLDTNSARENKQPIQHSPAPVEASSRLPVNMLKENKDNPWVEGLRSDLYRKGSSGSCSGKISSGKVPKPDKSENKRQQNSAKSPDLMKEHISKLCSQHDHQELHLCCMPPAPSYNFTPRIEQVKREVTKRSISVDNLTKTQRKKYPMTATRRRIPSSNSTTTEASSSVFELNDHSSTPRADLYNYRSRRRVDSLSNYPSDTESTCSSRIPRYYGSRKKELSDNDVKQIVNLVKTGERKLSGSLSSEIIIKKDPLSQRWELSSAPPKSASKFEWNCERNKAAFEDEVDVYQLHRSLRDQPDENTFHKRKEDATTPAKVLNNWGFGFLLGLLVAAAFRYILYPSACFAYESFTTPRNPVADEIPIPEDIKETP